MSGNWRKQKFLDDFPQASIELSDDTLAQRCKFNFSYFCKQAAGQNFDEWTHEQLVKLLNKLSEYSREPLSYWAKQKIGKSGSVLALYGAFPARSDFSHPKHVPHQAYWARFRLEQAVRLVGFVLPVAYDQTPHANGAVFDCNTFYVVFLDAEHKFYKTEQK